MRKYVLSLAAFSLLFIFASAETEAGWRCRRLRRARCCPPPLEKVYEAASNDLELKVLELQDKVQQLRERMDRLERFIPPEARSDNPSVGHPSSPPR